MRNTFINPQTQLEMKTDPPMQLVLLSTAVHRSGGKSVHCDTRQDGTSCFNKRLVGYFNRQMRNGEAMHSKNGSGADTNLAYQFIGCGARGRKDENFLVRPTLQKF